MEVSHVSLSLRSPQIIQSSWMTTTRIETGDDWGTPMTTRKPSHLGALAQLRHGLLELHFGPGDAAEEVFEMVI